MSEHSPHQFDPGSAGRLLKIGEVMAQTSLSRRTIYRGMREGTFPSNVQISAQRVAWRESEIEAWKQRLAQSPQR